MNPDDFGRYAEAVEAGPDGEEPLDAEARARELLMLRLRLLRGVEALPGPLTGRSGVGVREVLERYGRLGLLESRGTGWALSRRGLTLSNEVFADLI